MAGRLGKNLRSGNLAEELGLLLLKGIAAVAEVPRPEDFGLDGVATLLREDDSGLLYAEDSFYVQFKSASVKSIPYEGHEADWLQNLKLPLFIGSASMADGTLSLYPTVRLSQIRMENQYEKLVLSLETIQEGHEPPGQRTFNVGSPLLKWGLADLQSAEFRSKAYAMLKTVIAFEERNIKHRHLNYMENLGWVTNESVTQIANMIAGSHGDDGVRPILQSIVPHMEALSVKYLHAAGKDQRDVQAVVDFFQYMRRNGIHGNSLVGGLDIAGLGRQAVEEAQNEEPGQSQGDGGNNGPETGP